MGGRVRAAAMAVVLLVGGGATAACEVVTEPSSAGSASYPTTGRPTRIAINHNGFESKYVGRTADGGQFFLTTPFEPGGSEFVALYLFDKGGKFVHADVDAYDKRLVRQRLAGLGTVTYGRIEVEPFTVTKFGTTFGLVAHEPESSGDDWSVTVEPGDYMAFFPPWNLGDYDT